KLDKIGLGGVSLLLQGGRLDESGDFTKGAGLNEGQASSILKLMAAQGDGASATLQAIEKLVGDSEIAEQGFVELDQIASMINAAGYGDRVFIAPSVVRGLEYYTGPVFEAELLAEIP
ncbi:histidine--tRNA ligase, partial [Mesorhizobium sp. M8A.F.Ca.ET.173.01.1.1]